MKYLQGVTTEWQAKAMKVLQDARTCMISIAL